ncbi:MAG: hypothetical protein AAFS12_04930 [Cyanobacteria bacterium J06632_19]
MSDSRENNKIPILIELRFYKTSIIELIRDFLKRHQLWLEIAEIEKNPHSVVGYCWRMVGRTPRLPTNVLVETLIVSRLYIFGNTVILQIFLHTQYLTAVLLL